MRRPGVWIGLALAGLMGWMVWSSFNSAAVDCEVCITFEGRRQCATASAPSRDEAIRAATDIACTGLASGRDGNMACGRTQPSSVTCP